jgi:hypothetical protein
MDNNLFVSKYLLELPKKEEIQKFIEEELRNSKVEYWDDYLAEGEKVMNLIDGINPKYGPRTLGLAEGFRKSWSMKRQIKYAQLPHKLV